MFDNFMDETIIGKFHVLLLLPTVYATASLGKYPYTWKYISLIQKNKFCMK